MSGGVIDNENAQNDHERLHRDTKRLHRDTMMRGALS